MRPATLLRLAALLALLQYAAHTSMFLSWKPTHGPEEAALIHSMMTHRFNFGGSDRSYWDFYFGYGLLTILWGLVEVVVLWQLSRLARPDPSHLRPIIAVFIVANLFHAVLAWNYFFLAPVVGDVIVAATLVLAFLSSGLRGEAG